MAKNQGSEIAFVATVLALTAHVLHSPALRSTPPRGDIVAIFAGQAAEPALTATQALVAPNTS